MILIWCYETFIGKPIISSHATRTQAPPAALMVASAFLEKSLALTITGMFGSGPLPRTLKKPDLVTSTTGALSLLLLAAFLVCSETSDHNLSVLMVGQYL